MYKIFIIIFIFSLQLNSTETINPKIKKLNNFNFGIGMGASTKQFGRGLYFDYSYLKYSLSIRNIVSTETFFVNESPMEKVSDLGLLFGYKVFSGEFIITYSIGIGYSDILRRTNLSTKVSIVPFFISKTFYESERISRLSIPISVSFLPYRSGITSFGGYFYGNLNLINPTLGILITYNIGSKNKIK